MRTTLFSNLMGDTFIHNLSGLTKLLSFLIMTGSVMYSYDLRFILCVMALSFSLFRVAEIKFSQVKIIFLYVGFFLVLNALLTFLFSPQYGTQIYGTSHPLFKITDHYTLTQETLFFIVTKMLKYASVIPLGIIFVMSTEPGEMASSLARIGVHDKAAYVVSLTLRYFPDIQREYRDISQAQQARGLEMTSKVGVALRFKRSLMVILPLILSSLERVETISNAMELRGFGKKKRRSWYNQKRLNHRDFMALTVALLVLGGTLYFSFFINHSRFYNPFLIVELS